MDLSSSGEYLVWSWCKMLFYAHRVYVLEYAAATACASQRKYCHNTLRNSLTCTPSATYKHFPRGFMRWKVAKLCRHLRRTRRHHTLSLSPLRASSSLDVFTGQCGVVACRFRCHFLAPSCEQRNYIASAVCVRTIERKTGTCSIACWLWKQHLRPTWG